MYHPCKLVIVAILSDTIQIDDSKLVFFPFCGRVGPVASKMPFPLPPPTKFELRLRQERNGGAEVGVTSKLMVVYVTVGKLE